MDKRDFAKLVRTAFYAYLACTLFYLVFCYDLITFGSEPFRQPMLYEEYHEFLVNYKPVAYENYITAAFDILQLFFGIIGICILLADLAIYKNIVASKKIFFLGLALYLPVWWVVRYQVEVYRLYMAWLPGLFVFLALYAVVRADKSKRPQEAITV